MPSTELLAVGAVGNALSVVLFLSPLPTFVQIIRAKSAEGFSAVPYIATLLNCLLWLFYGSPLVKWTFLIVTINAFGTFIESVYICVFLYYAKNRRERIGAFAMLAVVLMFFALVVGANMGFVHNHHGRKALVGILCVVFGTVMYIAPLTVMKRVITTKSTEFMPLTLSVANLLNATAWTVYARIAKDLYVTIPNGLGVLFAVAQLVLYSCYCGRTRRERAIRRAQEKELELAGAHPAVEVDVQV